MDTKTAGQRKSIADMLLESNLLTRDQLLQAQDVQRKNGSKIEDVLVSEKMVNPEQLALLTSLQIGIPFVNLRKQEVDPRAVELISEAVCRQHQVVPLQVRDGALIMAMQDPSDIQVIDFLAAQTRKRIEPVLALAEDIQETIDINYRVSGEIEKQLSQLPTFQATAEDENAQLSAEAIAQAPVVRILDLIIRQGARDRASDVHIEPQDTELRVRFRIDGILHEVMTLPMNVHSALLSRVKIMAGRNIAERRRPQDGQITFKDAERVLDIRVATSNTVNGEMAVLRLLDKTFAFLTLPELGFMQDALQAYRQMLKTPFGMVLISGPTGSGKTTTLYASINQLDSVGRNIITIEDPVEYHFGSINQMQVNTQAGVTFATGLRACMRLDPDIILVGEIRDRETAQVSSQAALTGHLVLSSVHANDAFGVVYRLVDLGVEPFDPPLEYPEHLPVAQYAVAIGLALRQVTRPKDDTASDDPQERAQTLRINLVPHSVPWWFPTPIRLLFLAGLVAGLVLALVLLGGSQSASNLTEDLRTQLNGIQGQVNLLQSGLKERGEKEAAIKEFRDLIDSRGATTTLFLKIQGLIPEGVTILDFRLVEESVSITGSADSPEAAFALVKSLREFGETDENGLFHPFFEPFSYTQTQSGSQGISFNLDIAQP